MWGKKFPRSVLRARDRASLLDSIAPCWRFTDNTALSAASSDLRQGLFTSSVSTQNDLADIWTYNPAVGSHTPTLDPTYLQKATRLEMNQLRIVLRNASMVNPVVVTLFKFSPRRAIGYGELGLSKTPFSVTEAQIATALYTQIKNQLNQDSISTYPGPATTAPAFSNPGFLPTCSSWFRKNFRVRMRRTMVVAPGKFFQYSMATRPHKITLNSLGLYNTTGLDPGTWNTTWALNRHTTMMWVFFQGRPTAQVQDAGGHLYQDFQVPAAQLVGRAYYKWCLRPLANTYYPVQQDLSAAGSTTDRYFTEWGREEQTGATDVLNVGQVVTGIQGIPSFP